MLQEVFTDCVAFLHMKTTQKYSVSYTGENHVDKMQKETP